MALSNSVNGWMSRRALVSACIAFFVLAGALAAAQVWTHDSVAVPDPSVEGGVTTIDVIPHVESVVERGQALQFRAIVHLHGAVVAYAPVTWSVPGRVGTINSTGLLVATTACLPWDAIGLVVATLDVNIPGRQPPSDGALVAVHHNPTCLPTVHANLVPQPAGSQ